MAERQVYRNDLRRRSGTETFFVPVGFCLSPCVAGVIKTPYVFEGIGASSARAREKRGKRVSKVGRINFLAGSEWVASAAESDRPQRERGRIGDYHPISAWPARAPRHFCKSRRGAALPSRSRRSFSKRSCRVALDQSNRQGVVPWQREVEAPHAFDQSPRSGPRYCFDRLSNDRQCEKRRGCKRNVVEPDHGKTLGHLEAMAIRCFEMHLPEPPNLVITGAPRCALQPLSPS